MKQRFSSLDVKVLVAELRSALLTLRLSNAYDLSSRIFLLKFAKPSHREQLIIDSGFRCHLTQFARATAAAPSAFVARLRKYLKTRRVTEVRQVGTDRVIEIIFSDGVYRLFLEFYAGGNIILTDAELNILCCLRTVSVEEGEEVRLGGKYMLERRQNVDGIPDITESRIRTGLESALERAKLQEDPAKKNKKRKAKSADSLRKALATSHSELPPPLLEHASLVKNFDASISIEDALGNESTIQALLDVLHFAREVVDKAASGEGAKGYIVAKISKPKEDVSDPADADKENLNLMYEDFQPFRPSQYENDPTVHVLEFDGFNATVDEFFSSIESQKLESRLHEREEHARKKIDAARKDHERRLGGLQQVQELNVRKAQALEANLQRVQEATAAVNGLIAQGMDWVEIARLIEMEQARNNPVAEIIKLPLKLYENTITLRLYEAEVEADDEDYDTGSDPEDTDDEEHSVKKSEVIDHALDVDIDLALSAWSNSRQYYDQKRTAATKEQKTLQASEKALKSTERKINADLKKGLKEEKEVLRPVRKQFWFEKFFYFISSEGYLVLAGKDVQQNEILYKRYLSKGDIYVHADLNGAATVIIKNKPGSSSSPIPPSTLSQAGSLCIATSSAWDSKAIMSAWWVEADQVSKTAPNGEYLSPGAFVVKGKKNFLPPAQLLLGFGVMFQVSDESLARHTKHRVVDEKVEPEVQSSEIASPLTAAATSNGSQADSRDVEKHDDSDHHGDGDETESETDDRDVHTDVEEEKEYQNPLQLGGPTNNHEQSDIESNNLDVEETETNKTAPEVENDSDVDSDQDDAEDSVQPSSSVTQTGTERTNQDNASTASTTKPPPYVRGKQGKKAKIKSKYAHQDEADRVLALRLLGSKDGQGKAQSEAEKKVNKELEAQAAKDRRRQQHIQTQAVGKESEEKRKQRMDQGLETMDDEELAELKMIDAFIGSPLPGDEILDALVVCAPWDTVGPKLKWRVKLQPGAQKKGKAVREVLEHWNRQIADREKKRMPDATDERYAEEKTARREGELIKALRDVEVVGIIPVTKLRTMISGGGGSSGEKGKGQGGNKGGGRGGRGSKKSK